MHLDFEACPVVLRSGFLPSSLGDSFGLGKKLLNLAHCGPIMDDKVSHSWPHPHTVILPPTLLKETGMEWGEIGGGSYPELASGTLPGHYHYPTGRGVVILVVSKLGEWHGKEAVQCFFGTRMHGRSSFPLSCGLTPLPGTYQGLDHWATTPSLDNWDVYTMA